MRYINRTSVADPSVCSSHAPENTTVNSLACTFTGLSVCISHACTYTHPCFLFIVHDKNVKSHLLDIWKAALGGLSATFASSESTFSSFWYWQSNFPLGALLPSPPPHAFQFMQFKLPSTASSRDGCMTQFQIPRKFHPPCHSECLRNWQVTQANKTSTFAVTTGKEAFFHWVVVVHKPPWA